MAYGDIITALLAVLGTVSWAGVKLLWSKVDKQAASLNDFRVHVAQEYVRTEVIGSMRSEIINHLERIEDRLDRKADKYWAHKHNCSARCSVRSWPRPR